MSSIYDLKDRRMTISHHLCRTHTHTPPPHKWQHHGYVKKNKRVSKQANMPSFTRIGTITLESGALDTMIPAKVGKYDRRGPPTRSMRHREAFAIQNTYTLRLVGLDSRVQLLNYNYGTGYCTSGTVYKFNYWIELNFIQHNNYIHTTITCK